MILTRTQPLRILLVEDRLADIALTVEAFAGSALPHEMSVARDGDAALALLRGEELRPDLVLLDLNLPGTDGWEVLAAIKSDPALRSTPVIVLTTSAKAVDVEAAYAAHANCFIIKPVDFAEFQRVIATIEQFWLTVAALPSRLS